MRIVDQVEIARLVLEYAKVLAWPLVVLTGLLLFRLHIGTFIDRLETLEGPGGLKACARRLLDDVAESTEQLAESIPPDAPQAQAVRDLHEAVARSSRFFKRPICGYPNPYPPPLACQRRVSRAGDRCYSHQRAEDRPVSD